MLFRSKKKIPAITIPQKIHRMIVSVAVVAVIATVVGAATVDIAKIANQLSQKMMC